MQRFSTELTWKGPSSGATGPGGRHGAPSQVQGPGLYACRKRMSDCPLVVFHRGSGAFLHAAQTCVDWGGQCGGRDLTTAPPCVRAARILTLPGNDGDPAARCGTAEQVLDSKA